MSQYATVADLDLTINTANWAAGGIDDATKNAALTRASALADGYLESQFALPLTSWSYDLTRVVCEIAAYYLIRRRGFRPDGSDAVWRTDYDSAVDWLRRVSTGEVNPALSDSTPNAIEGGPTVTTSGAGRVVGSGTLAVSVGPMDPHLYPAGPNSRGW